MFTNDIEIRICKGKDLAPKDVLTKSSDPYCCIKFPMSPYPPYQYNDKKPWSEGIRTPVIKSNLNPEWNYSVHGLYGITRETLINNAKDINILIDVWDWNKVLSPSFMGTTTLNLGDLLPLNRGCGKMETWLALHPHPGKNEKVSGEIFVSVTYDDHGLPPDIQRELEAEIKIGQSQLDEIWCAWVKGGQNPYKSVKELEKFLIESKLMKPVLMSVLNSNISQKQAVQTISKDWIEMEDNDLKQSVLNEIFIAADVNHDGEVDFKEIVLCINTLLTSDPKSLLLKLIHAYDTNGDGVLSKDELTVLFQSRMQFCRGVGMCALAGSLKKERKNVDDFKKTFQPFYDSLRDLTKDKDLAMTIANVWIEVFDLDHTGSIKLETVKTWNGDEPHFIPETLNFLVENKVMTHPSVIKCLNSANQVSMGILSMSTSLSSFVRQIINKGSGAQVVTKQPGPQLDQ